MCFIRFSYKDKLTKQFIINKIKQRMPNINAVGKKSRAKWRTKMTTKTIGEIEWGDADLGSSDFMRLSEGSNVVRIFTKPYQSYIVWTQDATGKTRKIKSAVNNCPLIKRGETAKPNWHIGVINRETGEPAILEIGPQIFKGILELKGKAAWGDPRAYDIDISRKPKGTNPLYTVSPNPKSKLTDEEKGKIKEFMGRVDLVAMTAPPTPEEVLEQLGLPPEQPAPSVSNDFEDFDSPSEDSDDSDDSEDFDFSNL